MRYTRTPAPFRCAAALGSLVAATHLLIPGALAQEAEPAAEAEAEEDEEGSSDKLADRVRAVERKAFLKRRRFEIQPYVGIDINDAFFQHVFVGAAGAYHLEDSLALELRGGFAVAEIEKGSVRFVRVATGSLLEGAPSLVAHLDADVTWAPVYGKLSLFGESILHFDTFITAGAGIFVSERGERASADSPLEQATNVNPAVNLGIGQRYFINEWLVFRFELRNYSYLETGPQSDLQNVTILGLSLSGFFPTTFEYEYQ